MWQKAKNVYHLLMAFMANVQHRFPSRYLTVIGVTGTDGKTTTVNLIYHMLHEAGLDASMISTTGAIIDGKTYNVGFHVTTPSPWLVQRFIRMAGQLHITREAQRSAAFVSKACTASSRVPPRFLVLEVTSHAIDQHRIFGIHFDIGLITNVSYEHLDYHRTYENYVKTKLKLLQRAKIAIANRDDESFKFMSEKQKTSNKKFVTYGLNQEADVNPKNFPFKTNLKGEFNTYNCLAMIAVGKEIGLTDEQIRSSLLNFKLPKGRMEIVHEGEFTVMIDFAHTPNALKHLLSSVKKEYKGKIIHVFGSAGERDRQKRPEMGKISSQYANIIILTAEDPRSESIEKINTEIKSGITNHQGWEKDGKLFNVPNRQEAIIQAIKRARKGDLVLLTGKGHEQSMNYGMGEQKWDETQAVEKALVLRV